MSSLDRDLDRDLERLGRRLDPEANPSSTAREQARTRLVEHQPWVPVPTRRRSRGVIAGWSVASVATVAGLLWFGGAVRQDRSQPQEQELVFSDPPTVSNGSMLAPTTGSDSQTGTSPTPLASGTQVFLVVGTDRGLVDDAHAVSAVSADAIMLVGIDPDAPAVSVVSLPRDLSVTFPDGRTGRLGELYAGSSPAIGMINAVRENFGVPIHHYVEVEFDDLTDLVDGLGGVEIFFYFPARDRYSGLDVGGGCQTLDGTAALAYARARHIQSFVDGRWTSDPANSDLHRISRQQDLLRRTAKAARVAIEQDPLGDGREVIRELMGSLRVDPTLDFDTVLALVEALAPVDPDQVSFRTLPVTFDNVAGTLTWDPASARPYLDALVAPADPARPSPEPGPSTTAVDGSEANENVVPPLPC